jgi:hypothetical protein
MAIFQATFHKNLYAYVTTSAHSEKEADSLLSNPNELYWYYDDITERTIRAVTEVPSKLNATLGIRLRQGIIKIHREVITLK